MTDVWKILNEKIKGVGGAWTAYMAVGSFALYLLGYLSLRFQLTVLGIGTDLTVLDERYLFAGARFMIYLVSAVPIVVLVALALSAVIYLPYRILPGAFGQKFGVWFPVARKKCRKGLLLPIECA